MRLTRPLVATALTAATALLVAGQAPAGAAEPLEPHQTFTMIANQDGTISPSNIPASGEDIPNIDSVKSTLRAYYGAGSTKQTDPAHAFSSLAPATTYLPDLVNSPYAHDTESIGQSILDALPDTAPANAAVVFDVDSTLLSDYGNEEDMNFNYDSSLNAVWVNNELFPAVAGMVTVVQTLESEGYDIYGITGRPYNQEDATIANLTKVGFTTDGTPTGTPLFDNDNLYTKWNTADAAAKPAYIGDCTLSTTCNTVEYKANTRKHIEQDLGDTIMMNVGDQWSDLEGGYADKYTKLPNPSYFLGAADIDGAPTTDTSMVPPTTYTMAPDGSSGTTAAIVAAPAPNLGGDVDIPNEGLTVTEIRGYYAATNGIANKTASPYIADVTGLEKTWTSQIVTSCQQAVKAVSKAKHKIAATKKALSHAKGMKAKSKLRRKLRHLSVPRKPAVVFDSDDTTLWNYDMEDGAMKFVFDAALQNVWVQGEQMYAVPGMPQLVAKVADAGCTIMGLTGRSNDQKYATLGNLVKNGYSDFSRKYFFTKWYDQNDSADVRAASRPSYLSGCATATCSTIDFKSLTRKHIEKDLGFDIVANLGDQFSDLIGGYADKTYKVPNPTYYLP